ncbi:hypothetical protein CBR_g31136 [Chara braunii]|uniref:Uncharacterized protein n=1 Tax=Chara braunii TaxID=69332 RepID=A0A388LEI4_CHABU|nr:hypothetical protein CBR_g31136 [Chara braunii]|eukprot:GBG80677.1 hypothetical protein CBR_g31136 [Chara braunii]
MAATTTIGAHGGFAAICRSNALCQDCANLGHCCSSRDSATWMPAYCSKFVLSSRNRAGRNKINRPGGSDLEPWSLQRHPLSPLISWRSMTAAISCGEKDDLKMVTGILGTSTKRRRRVRRGEGTSSSMSNLQERPSRLCARASLSPLHREQEVSADVATSPTTARLASNSPQVALLDGEKPRVVESDFPSPPSPSPFSDEIARAVETLAPQFLSVDQLVAANLNKVLNAFQSVRLGPHHFSGSTGYGHADAGGREALDYAFARVMGAEMACVRSQFFSGTHAISCALYGVLRPGDELLAAAGPPYDTLEEVIGLRGTPGHGSLKELGVSYREVDLTSEGRIDWTALESAVGSKTKCVLVQRSCGYSWRPSLTIPEIGRIVQIVKRRNRNCIVLVDNCYGEFVSTSEPAEVGADLVAGSLIKNPGGTIVASGGYIAGGKEMVSAALARLSAPGIGMDAGAASGTTMRLMLQGLFLAPQMVGEAIKSSLLIAEVMSARGYEVQPPPRVQRNDIIQAVKLGSRERLLSFCAAVQTRCPVGSYIKPVAGRTPGYEDEVVFADGTFIDGSTSELSCDGPLRPPYIAFCQGATHWSHWALVLAPTLEALDQSNRSGQLG